MAARTSAQSYFYVLSGEKVPVEHSAEELESRVRTTVSEIAWGSSSSAPNRRPHRRSAASATTGSFVQPRRSRRCGPAGGAPNGDWNLTIPDRGGAILRYAVDATVAGLDIQTAGLILMVIGVVGLVIGLFLLEARERPVVADDPPRYR